jgi:hopanoid biosynthesis associated radical SAM protein HpnJ
MRTLFLNPPSFEGFDAGAGSRWPATREVESYWYPVWLTYPAGMLPDSRLLDPGSHKISVQETIDIARTYEFVVVFTSTTGFQSDIRLAQKIKEGRSDLKIAFVGPHVHIQPDASLTASPDIDFVVRGEFDHAVVDYARGAPLENIPGASYRKNGRIVHNPPRAQLQTADLDALPFATDVYARDLTIENYTVPFLLHPYVSLYSSRGCPAMCTFCLWPQTLSGHDWRVRSSDNVIREARRAIELFPQMKELMWDDDTFNIRKDRVLDLCARLKPLKIRWSCNARVHSDYETLKAMADAGARLFVVGFESGDDQILKNIRKGTTVEQARRFARDCRRVGIRMHGDFIIGLPGETKETIERTMTFARELDCETIQVSIAHAYAGTELHDQVEHKGLLTMAPMTDDCGHQTPHIAYAGLTRPEMMGAVNRFYDSYYFRPRIIWRIVREALWDSYERTRLYHEAVSFLRLRAERWKYVRQPLSADQAGVERS